MSKKARQAQAVEENSKLDVKAFVDKFEETDPNIGSESIAREGPRVALTHLSTIDDLNYLEFQHYCCCFSL